MLAGFLYLGAFIGLTIYSIVTWSQKSTDKASKLKKKDIPWLAGSIISGGIIAPICLMLGLTFITGFSTSLLLNLEGLTTAMIAIAFFKENAGKRLWFALICMTIAGIFLSWDTNQDKFEIIGPALIVISMICWGIDNNVTRNISDKNPVQIVQLKGLVAGSVSILIAIVIGTKIIWDINLIFALIIGALSYGISIVFFIKALRGLGSFRTGTFFSLGPFIGAIISIILLKEWIGWVILPATILMVIGVWLVISEKHLHTHKHDEITHTHLHTHQEPHHIHTHSENATKPHTHEHTHFEAVHVHAHWPDTHHRHEHE
jgi:drug/metabolite transporter (DMT)-like permease